MKYVIGFAVALGLFSAYAWAQVPRATQAPVSARYALVTSTDGSVAWRLDTITGEVGYCLTAMRTPLDQKPTRLGGCDRLPF